MNRHLDGDSMRQYVGASGVLWNAGLREARSV